MSKSIACGAAKNYPGNEDNAYSSDLIAVAAGN